MQITRYGTYNNGVLVLDEQLESEQNGKVFKVVLFESKTAEEKKRDFFKSVEKHSFPLPEDYKFDREDLHER